MKILITGAKGFVGRNLAAQLKNIKDGKARNYGALTIDEVYEYDIDSTAEELDKYCQKADFVFNLAGVNRPKEQSEFMKGNFGFASTLLDTLKKHRNTCPVMLSSSIQATLMGRFAGSDYGKSKKAGEELFFDYAKETGAKVLVYRFPNLFGKWCRPNYNSAVATFCNNIAHDLPIQVNDRTTELELLYVDDLVDEMIGALKGEEHHCVFDGMCTVLQDDGKYCAVPVSHHATLGEIVDLLEQFHEQPKTLCVPEIPNGSFAKKLYSTYLSYLPKEKVAFPLKMNVDPRGSFTELLKSKNCGQVSINISKPGITKGQHWHNTKWEFFIVVAGHGLIQERCLTQPSPQERALKTAGEAGAKASGPIYNTADPSLYMALKEKAEEMRKNPTEAETVLWNMLRNKNLDAKFRRQHIIGDYIADFVDLETQLIIEVDGGYHNSPEQRDLDAERSRFLQQHGFSVLRFNNEEVLNNIDATLSVISNALVHLKSPLEGEIQRGQVLNFFASGDKIEAVHMLPGYTHNIINLSDTEDLVTVMWANEAFDPTHPDTYGETV
jgi:UDP-2-acetamido-2,6-beta-L-arabino-hexul-4-ose reductase